jgi:hypothetical protein
MIDVYVYNNTFNLINKGDFFFVRTARLINANSNYINVV